MAGYDQRSGRPNTNAPAPPMRRITVHAAISKGLRHARYRYGKQRVMSGFAYLTD